MRPVQDASIELERERLRYKLRELRMDKGLLQRDLAELSGLTTNTVSRIESGVSEPTLTSYITLLSVMGYEIKAVKRS